MFPFQGLFAARLGHAQASESVFSLGGGRYRKYAPGFLYVRRVDLVFSLRLFLSTGLLDCMITVGLLGGFAPDFFSRTASDLAGTLFFDVPCGFFTYGHHLLQTNSKDREVEIETETSVEFSWAGHDSQA
jgi:hypothetical protein